MGAFSLGVPSEERAMASEGTMTGKPLIESDRVTQRFTTPAAPTSEH
jgi:hypothetical protein